MYVHLYGPEENTSTQFHPPNELSWIIEVLHTELYPWIQGLMVHYGRGLEPRLSQKYVLVVSRNDFFLDNSHYSV